MALIHCQSMQVSKIERVPVGVTCMQCTMHLVLPLRVLYPLRTMAPVIAFRATTNTLTNHLVLAARCSTSATALLVPCSCSNLSAPLSACNPQNRVAFSVPMVRATFQFSNMEEWYKSPSRHYVICEEFYTLATLSSSWFCFFQHPS